MNEDQVKAIIKQVQNDNQYNFSGGYFHAHTGLDSPKVNISDVARFPATANNGDTIQFSTSLNTWQAVSGSTSIYGRMHLGAAQTINDGTTVQVNVNTATFTGAGITVDTTNKKFTVLTAGVYLIYGQVAFSSTPASGKVFAAYIYTGSAGGTLRAGSSMHSSNTNVITSAIMTMKNLVVGDDIYLYGFHNNGSNVGLQTGVDGTFLEVSLV